VEHAGAIGVARVAVLVVVAVAVPCGGDVGRPVDGDGEAGGAGVAAGGAQHVAAGVEGRPVGVAGAVGGAALLAGLNLYVDPEGGGLECLYLRGAGGGGVVAVHGDAVEVRGDRGDVGDLEALPAAVRRPLQGRGDGRLQPVQGVRPVLHGHRDATPCPRC